MFRSQIYGSYKFDRCLCLLSGWGGGGLGSSEQGIVDPIKHAEVRDRTDMYKGVGMSVADPFEQFRKSKSQGFIQRMRAKEEAGTCHGSHT